MQLIIHRGTHEIGGSCIELKDENTRLLFDFGLPLTDNTDLKDLKLDISGLYKNEKADIDAIFISHPHPDHYGLLEHVNPEILIYTSQTSSNIIKNISKIKGNNNFSDLIIKTAEKPLKIGKFTVIAHTVDHSAPGSLAFEILYNGKKILYTGDLRFHGRIAHFSNDLKKIKDVDYLIMEGSTLGRTNQKFKTENDVFEEMTNVFNTDKLCIVKFSAQNPDRFISVFKACLKNKKTLVIDPYTCFCLEEFKNLSKNIPQWDWNNIKVYFGVSLETDNLKNAGKLYKYKSKKISVEEILSHPEKYVVKSAGAITKAITTKYDLDKIVYVYSLWQGYLYKSSSQHDVLKNQHIYIHTSGHAYIKDLQNFVEKLKPKTIIPIHTQYPEKYAQLYSADIKMLGDGEIFEL